ncbi:MAG TPA: hypothetical protein ENK57_20620, partial [Polyangiaceae bacterium]|nr:hypothetical protein [Polyangiaceae bacterium]
MSLDAERNDGSLAAMVGSRMELPLESTASTAPESEAVRLLQGWIDALARGASVVLRQLEPMALGCAVILGGCGSAPTVEVEGVVRDGRTGAPIAGATVSAHGGAAVETDEQGRFSVPMHEGADRQLVATAEGKCPVTETVHVRSSGTEHLTMHLFERLEVAQEYVQVGFDSVVRVEVRLRCEADAPIEWEQIGGRDLEADLIQTEDRGRILTVHTHPIEDFVQLDDRLGVIAFDRRQRGEYRFRLTARFGGVLETREVRIVAAPLASGLFQVPAGTDVYLNGGSGSAQGWILTTKPAHSETEMRDPDARISVLRPDRFGTYTVEHRGTGVQLMLQAGAYEDVPRDCGRAECHGAEEAGWQTTAHASTFRRGVEGGLGPAFERRCWSCHATGVDFGINNGGLHHTAARAGWTQPEPAPGVFDEIPRRVRRHGSVWCSACHGPGRIIPPQFRWQYGSKFQVGVCARCHDVDPEDRDANHSSPQVDEWRRSPMSRFVRGLSDRDPALRAPCAQCHSAQGFVSWRRHGQAAEIDRTTVAPITCAACHDAHSSDNPRGLRVYDTSDAVAGTPGHDMGAGALCATCHRPSVAWSDRPDRAPHAAQAGLLLGRGARTVADGGEGMHAQIADTCVRCHMVRPSPADPSFGTVGGHTFNVRARGGDAALAEAACSPCHGEIEPSTIGVADWNHDGTAQPITREHDDALTVVTELLSARIFAADIRDRCTPSRRARGVVDHDARLHLVDEAGVILGDC